MQQVVIEVQLRLFYFFFVVQIVKLRDCQWISFNFVALNFCELISFFCSLRVDELSEDS